MESFHSLVLPLFLFLARVIRDVGTFTFIGAADDGRDAGVGRMCWGLTLNKVRQQCCLATCCQQDNVAYEKRIEIVENRKSCGACGAKEADI